ncbi:MAG TPA: response regulator [Desulfotignum sp.]|nr:response regulator [Desulfotignum sp.]
MRKNLLSQTKLVAKAVNIDRFQSLTGTAADIGNPEYLWLKEQLAAVRSVTPKCRFLYLMGQHSDGQVFFYADSEPVGSKHESPPGQIYGEISAGYLRAFDTKTAQVEGPVTDRWGTWVSALVPLTDPLTGNLITMLGMDVDARHWKRELIAKSILPAGLATLVLLAIVFCGRLAVLLQGREELEKRVQERTTTLRESENRFNRAIEGTGAGLWDWDMVNNAVFFSHRWKSMLGYADHEVENAFSGWQRLWHPEDAARIQKAVNDYLEGKTAAYEIEHRVRHKDGSWHWIITRGDIERNAAGDPVRWTGTNIDITERKRIENELAGQTALLRKIFDAFPGFIGLKDSAGRFLMLNKALSDQWGIAPEEMIGKTDVDLLGDIPEARQFMEDDREVIQSGREKRVSAELVPGRDGRPRWFTTVKLPFQRPCERKKSLLFVATDITEGKQAELKLLETNRQLEKTTARANQMAAEAEMADIAKSEFLANMSHEIRTPMNGVIGMTGLLLDTDLNPDQLRYAEAVRASGESLLGLINDILDFSKIEAGKLDLEILDFDLQDLMDDFAATMALQAHQKGLELNCGISPDIPPLLRGDPGRLRQILTNLAGNAVKFTHSGEVSIRVTLESDVPQGVLLRFSVADTGIGIPMEKQTALFQKFSQVDASITRQFGGTGLGLAISRQLAEMMGGEIGVQSATGKGAEFWFTVRMEKQSCRPAAKTLGPADLKDIRVLIVDDNATNREILTAQLESWHMRVFAVSDGPSALEAIHGALQDNDPYQVAVIDMQMPEMDGGELGRAIASDNRLAGIRMVLLTSLGVRGDSRRFEQIGFNAYLTKPVRPQELKATLSSILKGHGKGLVQPGAITTRHSVREIRNLFVDRGIRILLAEDNITNQQVALGILKKIGLRADAVANGLEVLEALKTLPYDLVLMDVQMPEMDGLEATRQIRIRERQAARKQQPAIRIPIIAMTAHAMAGDREKCLEAGMNGYVSKPIEPLTLVDELNKWISTDPNRSSHETDGITADELDPIAGGKGLSVEIDGFAAVVDEPDAIRVFDRAALLERLMDDQALMETIITGFLEDMPEQIALLTSFVENGRTEQAGGQAHKIKGAAGNVTAWMLQDTAQDMETAGKAGDLATLHRLLPELEQKFQQVKAQMESNETGTFNCRR